MQIILYNTAYVSILTRLMTDYRRFPQQNIFVFERLVHSKKGSQFALTKNDVAPYVRT